MVSVAPTFNATSTLDGDLLKAAAGGKRYEIDGIIRNGANVNAVDENGYSTLILAIQSGCNDTIIKLINAGADDHWQAPDGMTARGAAAASKDPEMAAGLDWQLNARASEKLLDAIRKKDTDRVQEILESGDVTNLNTTSRSGGWKPVDLAISEDNLVCLDLLLQAGASPNGGERDKSPLTKAIDDWDENPHIVQKLLEYGADPNAPDAHGFYPLHIAAKKGQETTLLLLLEHGADVNVNLGKGDTAVHAAAESGNAEIIRILGAHHAEMNSLNHNGQPPLEIAILYRHREAFEALLEAGADPHRQGKNGITLIMDAAWAGEASLIPQLAARGLLIDAQVEGQGNTALIFAATKGKGESVRTLLDMGANYDLTDKDGKTALDIARDKGHVGVERQIREKIAADVAAGIRQASPVKKPFRLALGVKNG